MKLKLPKTRYEPIKTERKQNLHSEEYDKLMNEATERIMKNRSKQLDIIQEAKNYIHNYDDLPRCKD